MPEKPKLTKFPKGHKKTEADKELVKQEKLIEKAKDCQCHVVHHFLQK
jgi:hypothetical protein